MGNQHFKRSGLDMGFCSNFYLELQQLIVLSINQRGASTNRPVIHTFQSVRNIFHFSFHVKQNQSFIHKYMSLPSISSMRKALCEIFSTGERSYNQFPMPFKRVKTGMVKAGMVKASGFTLQAVAK